MKKQLIIIGILVLALAIYGASKKASFMSQPNQNTIKIGAVLGLTGEAATDSLNVKRGLDLAKEDLASKGTNVEIYYQDDKTDPKQTVSAIQYLVTTIKPQTLVGPIWSFLDEAAVPVIAANKLVSYAPADTSEFVSGKSLYNFRGAPLNALLEEPLTEWLKANHKTRAALITSKDGWGVSVHKPFEEAARAAGAAVVVDETIQSFSPDAATIAATIMTKIRAAHADVILWTGYEPDGVTIAKKREELGLNGVSLIDAGTILKTLASRNAITKKEAGNSYFIAVPTSEAFIAKFKAKYGEEPNSYADRAYDGLMILVDAIQHAPTGDGDSIALYMHDHTHYQGYGGLYEFNENGDVKGGGWVIRPVVE